MKTVLKYPGSKWSMTSWIISNFPYGYEKMTYLEPYFGSGAVFFNKNRSAIETINDIDKQVINLFSVLREKPELLSKLIELTPWARDEYRLSYELSGDAVEDARRFLVRCWQAIGTKTSDITGWSNNIKPGDTGLSRWSKLDKEIIAAAQRLKNKGMQIVQIENMAAVDLIKRYNRKETLIYCDPPYVLKTRSGRIYRHEMTDEQHIELLETLKQHKGNVLLSGYDNEIYGNQLNGWYKQNCKANTEKGGSAIETLWMNYEPPAEQISLIV